MIFIQKAAAEDAPALLDIYAVYVQDTAISFEYDVPTVEEFRSRIEKTTARYPYLKAVDEAGNILGYAYAAPFKGRRAYDWAVESTVYVRRGHAGRGIGRLLYTSLEQALREMGILNMNACIACTEVPDAHLDNTSSRFHEAMGFAPVGTFHQCGYKFGRWYDMVWMEKLLGEHPAVPPEIRPAREIQGK